MLRLTLYECVVKICIQRWFLIRNWIFGRIICRTMKNKEVNAIELRNSKAAKKRQGSQLRIELLHYLHVNSRTLIATPTPSCAHTMHINWYNTGIQRMWTDSGKNTVNSQEYCLPRRVCGLLLSPVFSQIVMGFQTGELIKQATHR